MSGALEALFQACNEAAKNSTQEPPNKPPKESPNEPPKESPNEPPNEPPKESRKESPNEPPKESRKESPNEPPKESPKDSTTKTKSSIRKTARLNPVVPPRTYPGTTGPININGVPLRFISKHNISKHEPNRGYRLPRGFFPKKS